MTPTDWAAMINGGNDIAMQWYALSHQTTVPALPSYVTVPGGRVNAPSSGVVLVAFALLAFVMLRKSS